MGRGKLNFHKFIFLFLIISGFETFAQTKQSLDYHIDDNKAVLEPVLRITLSSSYAGLLEHSKDEGTRFKKGEILFSNRSELLKLEADILRRRIKSFEPEIKHYTNVLNDRKNQLRRGIIAEELVKEAAHEVTRLKNKVDVLRSELDHVEYKIVLLSQKAPFSGVVSISYKKQNEYARPGDNIIEIINDKQLLAVRGVSVTKLPRLKINAPVKINVSGKFYDAKIHFISPEVDASVEMVTVKVIIENSDGKLRPGMGCKVIFND